MRGLIFVLGFFVVSGHCAVFLDVKDEDPDHPGQCLGGGNLVYNKDEEVLGLNYGSCNRVICKGTLEFAPKKVVLEIYSCGVAEAEPPCETFSDSTLKYPDCCPRIRCPELKLKKNEDEPEPLEDPPNNEVE